MRFSCQICKEKAREFGRKFQVLGVYGRKEILVEILTFAARLFFKLWRERGYRLVIVQKVHCRFLTDDLP